MASELEVQVELKSSPDKVWESIMESTILFPKAIPDQYQSIEVIEGDGKSVGSIRLVTFAPGISEISSTKEKIEMVDEEKKTVVYSVVDGDMLKYYKNFKGKTAVNPKDNGEGSLVKWCCNYDKASEDVPNPDLIRDFAIKNFNHLDAYLLKA